MPVVEQQRERTARADRGSVMIVGNPDEVHVGHHLMQAARSLKLTANLCDVTTAYAASPIMRAINWRLRGHRPVNLLEFSQSVYEQCRREQPACMIATGTAPIDAASIAAIGRLGIHRVSFLTDDPWNPAHHAAWFMDTLPAYDEVFTPRQANVDDLRKAGCHRVQYLPFAYAPDVHFPEPPSTAAERAAFDSDVVFIGGADPERVSWMAPLIASGYRVALYGGYWERYPETRSAARGMADAATMRKAIGGAAIALCLVRRANRDGHSMRSFEVPAIGACMIVEDTPEHRQLFGEHGVAVEYVRTTDDACRAVGRLLQHADERRRLSAAAHALIVGDGHAWRDRLETILTVVR